MSGIRWSPDRRAQALSATTAAKVDALFTAAGHLREEADRTAPIEEAVLVGSGGISVDTDGNSASVYYDTPYAVPQHEDLSFRHDPGRRAKWLALTLQERASAVSQWMADRLRKGFR